MLRLLPILNYIEILEGGFSFSHMEIAGRTAVFEYHLKTPLPVGFEKCAEKDHILICADKNLLQLHIRIFEGQAGLPLPDVENYYYLPEEDRVIHRNVAQFVDKRYRERATKKNCFLKKEGRFLPQKQPLFMPAFCVPGESRKTFFELNDSVIQDRRMLTEYALDIINL